MREEEEEKKEDKGLSKAIEEVVVKDEKIGGEVRGEGGEK